LRRPMIRLKLAVRNVGSLEYRKLGKTSEKVSAIGMGTWRLGSTQNEKERLRQIEALQRGIELGMNLIDTAEYYADGGAERLVGEAIRDRSRDDVFIATKVWPTHLHHDDVLEACNRSIQRLGVRQIDLYQVHWPNPRIPIRETMNAMEKLVRDGKVRYIGVSNFSADQTKEAQDVLTKNELVSNQVEYSLTERSIEKGLLPYCEKEGITVIAYTPLGSGNIPTSLIPCSILVKYNLTPVQAALNWVTHRDGVVAIPKSAKREHTEENAGALSVRMSEEDYKLVSHSTM
jgi:diketogulonate reductase-like aldo/keto reductase